MWALAIKTTLGNVYHFEKLEDGGSVARCDSRIRLDPRSQTQDPSDGYVCGRCLKLKQSFGAHD